MSHGTMRGVGDSLLLVALVVGVVSVMTIVTRLEEHPANIASFRSERSANPVVAAPPTTLRDRLDARGARGAAWPDPLDHHDRGGQGDARLYLRDAAAMARGYFRVRPGRGETRTDLWINAPASIGSTSPPDASAGNLFVEE